MNKSLMQSVVVLGVFSPGLVFAASTAEQVSRQIADVSNDIKEVANLRRPADAITAEEQEKWFQAELSRIAAETSACRQDEPRSEAAIDERLKWIKLVVYCLEVARSNPSPAVHSLNAAHQFALQETDQALAAVENSAIEYQQQLFGEKEFIGIKWGIGVGFSHGFDEIVEEASIVDGVVRVKKDLTDQPRVILEFHSYIGCHGKRKNDVAIDNGCGPFAAVTSRDDKVVSGVATGFMYGWKTGTGADASGFSVGIGVILDSGGKELGSGFREGAPPPSGQTTVFLEEKSVLSGLLFFTRTF